MIVSKPPRPPDRLLVYGTLRPGFANPMSAWLAANAEWIGPSSLPGRLYDLGGYPGLALDGADSQPVIGDLYRIPAPRETWPLLDQYEDASTETPSLGEFRREIRPVSSPRDSCAVQAWVYIYQGTQRPLRSVPGNDYLAYCRTLSADEWGPLNRPSGK